jgi:hypothetical protein
MYFQSCLHLCRRHREILEQLLRQFRNLAPPVNDNDLGEDH